MDSEGKYYDSASLGEGSDCELCGWNGDSIRVEQMEGESQSWYVYRELGCYHGWSDYFDTPQEVIARLELFEKEEYGGWGYSKKELKEGKQELSNLIEGLKEFANS